MIYTQNQKNPISTEPRTLLAEDSKLKIRINIINNRKTPYHKTPLN